MVYPILPLYLLSVLGASTGTIGVIGVAAESPASILKLFSGIIADKYDNDRQLAFIGYFASFLNRLIILLASTWAVFWQRELLSGSADGSRCPA